MERSHIRRLLDATDGQVAIIFALVCLPLLLMTGLAIDFARQHNTNLHLQIATDMASLVGARAMEDGRLTDEDITQIAQTYYLAQLQSTYGDVACVPPAVSIDRTNEIVSVAGGCELSTIFGVSISGREKVAVAQVSSSKTKLTELEVALVLDLSASMIGSAEAEMKTAARDLVSTILNARTHKRVRVSLVPFSSSVNAGVYGNRAMGRHDHDDRAGDGVDKVCVRERTGVEQLTDAWPAPGQYVSENVYYMPSYGCPDVSVVPLSNNSGTVNATIAALSTTDSGSAGHDALAWAWYSLSPKWDSVWPSESVGATYDTADTVKAVVMLTDGAFNKWYDTDNPYHAIIARQDAVELCKGMRKEGVQIYVVAYNTDNGVAWYSPNVILKDCAGDNAFYFEADNSDELQDVFDQIANHLKWTRLTD